MHYNLWTDHWASKACQEHGNYSFSDLYAGVLTASYLQDREGATKAISWLWCDLEFFFSCKYYILQPEPNITHVVSTVLAHVRMGCFPVDDQNVDY